MATLRFIAVATLTVLAACGARSSLEVDDDGLGGGASGEGGGNEGGGPQFTNVTMLGLGLEHTCLLTPRSEVYCWGANVQGQLGNGDGWEVHEPKELQFTKHAVVALTAGRFHTCAVAVKDFVTREGEIYCWGGNESGQINGVPGGFTDSPRSLGGPRSDAPVDLAAGHEHTCALYQDGEVFCWGRNHEGQASPSGPFESVGFTRIEEARGAVDISAGGNFTCARFSAGNVRCWGEDILGQHGDGVADLQAPSDALVTGVQLFDAGGSFVVAETWDGVTEGFVGWGEFPGAALGPTPVSIPLGDLEPWAQMAAADGFACTPASADGGASVRVACWGDGTLGQLGDGTADIRTNLAFVSNAEVDGEAAMGAGEHHACAANLDGRVFCWGHNDFGQLGDGATETQFTPVSVAGF